MQPARTIDPPPWMREPATLSVVEALRGGGRSARFVGGCVRDTLLGRPVQDVDIATPEPPANVLKLLGDAGMKVIPTGLDHGTVTAVSDGHHFEITTLRADVETYGRHARVAFTDDWEADAWRRDFTVNALYADPDGTVYDPTGGLRDLDDRRIRFVGNPDQRIEEDALRLLRFFRFHALYGKGEPDAEALAACAAAAEKVGILSGERVSAELQRLLSAPDPVPVVTVMAETGVLDHVIENVGPVAPLAATVRVETQRREVDPLRRAAVLLLGKKPAAERLAARLRLSRAKSKRLVAIAGDGFAVDPGTDDLALRHLLFHYGHDRLADRIIVNWAMTAGADTAEWEALLARAAGLAVPRFPLRGADALDLGVPPGPIVGDILDEVAAWWEDGDFNADRAAALAHLEKVIARTV